MAYVPPHARKNRTRGARSGQSLSSLVEGQRRKSYGGSGRKDNNDILLESADFNHFHASLCRSEKYKIHAPVCSCGALSKLRRCHLVDVDGTFASRDPFDSLVVVPDPFGAENGRAAFVCDGTDRESFRRDATSCEKKLARAMFGRDASLCEKKLARAMFRQPRQVKKDLLDSEAAPAFEVSCAQCLLTAHQRNGFVAITSQTFEEMQDTVMRARDAADAKAQEGLLGPDHYHFTASLKATNLESLCFGTAEESQQAAMKILTEMDMGDVAVPAEMVDAIPSTALSSAALSSSYPGGLQAHEWLEMAPFVKFHIGHHLMCLLNLDPEDLLDKYIMVAGFVNGEALFELDLPGGKRCLGESTLGVALRKVESECSLRIDKAWISCRVKRELGGQGGIEGGINVVIPKGKERVNAFFVMPPPPV